MPAVPGSGFVVVEPELVFGCLEAILDRPAMALDDDRGLDRSPCRTPGGEVGEIAVGDITRLVLPRMADLEGEESNHHSQVLWTRGLLIRRLF